MPKIKEAADSRATTGGDPPKASKFKYWVTECFDEQEALALAFALAPVAYRGLEIDKDEILTEKLGFDSFNIEIPYKLPDPLGDIVEFDTAGGTQHVTQCIRQTAHGPVPAGDIADSRVVGLSRDGVEGVDQVIPKLEFAVARTYEIEAITGAYIKNLAALTGKVNHLAYSIAGAAYDAGELLFMGATGRIATIDGKRKWEITYRFSASANRVNIQVSPVINVAAKLGHEYLWVMYRKDEANNKFVETPDIAFVSELYEKASFQAFIV